MTPNPKKLLQGIVFIGFGLCLVACSLKAASERQAPPNASNEMDTVPELIVSGVDNYWQTATVKKGGESADSIIDVTHSYQVWHGLGGTFNEAGWQALLQLSESQRREVTQLLFDKQNGIGFEWGRIPIGASDFALSRYTLNDTAGDIDMAQFSIDHDRKFLIPYIQAARDVNRGVKFWGSPWTPPPWMKSNNAYDRGAFNPKYYDAYARYFVEWVSAYQEEGIAIDHVQPQNEPGWSQAYPSCGWGPSVADGKFTDREVTLGTFVEHYLAPSLEQAKLATDVWYGTLSNGKTFDTYWEALSEKGRATITGVGLQWGTVEHVSKLAATKGKHGKNLLVMQTEHMCGNYPWLSKKASSPLDANRNNFLKDQAPNNHAYAEESWDLISRWLTAGVHVYSAWNMVLDTGGFNMDIDRPWPQNALIAVDNNNRSYKITPAYYVFRHIGQFVMPQAKRIAVSGDALAFENPDKSIVAIFYNEQDATKKMTVSVSGELWQFEVPARGWATLHL